MTVGEEFDVGLDDPSVEQCLCPVVAAAADAKLASLCIHHDLQCGMTVGPYIKTTCGLYQARCPEEQSSGAGFQRWGLFALPDRRAVTKVLDARARNSATKQ